MSRYRRCVSMVLRTMSLYLVCAAMGLAQSSAPQTPAQQFAVSRQFTPNFIVREADLHKPVTIIAYGDTRFTDPSAPPTAVNATARRKLVARIAQEKPDAILLDGDLPLHGGTPSDYAVYRSETKVWRDDHLRIFPVLGNHEFQGCDVPQCLQNWWDAFPQLRTRRWYSAQLGSKLFVIGLDSDDSLLPPARSGVGSKLRLLRCPTESDSSSSSCITSRSPISRQVPTTIPVPMKRLWLICSRPKPRAGVQDS